MRLFIGAILICLVVVLAQPSGDALIEGFRLVEAASVADAMEQLYGQRAHMSHEMRPLFTTKFAGPAVTVWRGRSVPAMVSPSATKPWCRPACPRG